ncbi:phosphatase, partial [Streptomyces sp. SID4946]
MTTNSDTWTLTGPVDAARARALLARLTADAGVPARDRARFLAVLTALLRPCREGRRQRLTVTADEDLHLALDGAEPWRHTVACPSPPPRPLPRPDELAEADLAEALLGAGEDTAVVLAGLDEAEELVRFHREELHQTNQGVLALHAELEAAALAQRELLDAERAARAEAENARRLLTFLADTSASLNASLDHEDILRRLPKLLMPEYARHVDVWLVDDERTPPAERPAAAVTAA